MFVMFWLPIMPTCCLLVHFSSPAVIPGMPNLSFFDVSFVPVELCWFFMVFNMFLWLMLYFYLDAVMPSDYGIQKHPCFCVRKRAERSLNLVGNINDAGVDPNIFDRNDPIHLDELTKNFGSMTAVNKLKFSIKQGEIFTILGHNGAGKTTAIYMLTGMLKPSGGDASVYGYKISNNMRLIQQNLGLC